MKNCVVPLGRLIGSMPCVPNTWVVSPPVTPTSGSVSVRVVNLPSRVFQLYAGVAVKRRARHAHDTALRGEIALASHGGRALGNACDSGTGRAPRRLTGRDRSEGEPRCPTGHRPFPRRTAVR